MLHNHRASAGCGRADSFKYGPERSMEHIRHTCSNEVQPSQSGKTLPGIKFHRKEGRYLTSACLQAHVLGLQSLLSNLHPTQTMQIDPSSKQRGNIWCMPTPRNPWTMPSARCNGGKWIRRQGKTGGLGWVGRGLLCRQQALSWHGQTVMSVG
jgi:hypothetical protein